MLPAHDWRHKMELNESTHILESRSMPESPESTRTSRSDLTSHLADLDDEDEKLQQQQLQQQRSTIPMAAFNFINSIIGSGIVAMPYAIKEAGFGLGILLVLVVTAVTDYSLVLLIHAGELSNTNTYQDVVRAAFGRSGFVVLTVMQFLYPFIAMVSYNVIIGDTVTKIAVRISGPYARYTIIANREFIITASALVVTLPLSLYRNISRLVKVSLASIGCIVFVIGVVIARSGSMQVTPTSDAWRFADTGVTRAVSIMAYSFMCHHNSFIIYESLVDANAKRWNFVTHISVLFSMACSLVLGVTGYSTFTGYTQGDILENYCYSDDLVNVARVMFAVAVMLTYPVECFVTREVIENAVFAFKQPPTLVRHIAVTCVVVALTVLASLLTDCVGIVLELNGVINAAPLAYILPALCVLKLQQERIAQWRNLPCILTALFGASVSVIGLILAIVEIASGMQGCSHGHDLPYCRRATSQPLLGNNASWYPKPMVWREDGS